jgi:hypothetical protein
MSIWADHSCRSSRSWLCFCTGLFRQSASHNALAELIDRWFSGMFRPRRAGTRQETAACRAACNIPVVIILTTQSGGVNFEETGILRTRYRPKPTPVHRFPPVLDNIVFWRTLSFSGGLLPQLTYSRPDFISNPFFRYYHPT